MNGNTFFFPWEVNLMAWLQASLSGAGASILSFFSMFGEELALILVLGFLYWCFDKKLGKTLGLSILTALTWSVMIKNIILRRRPYFDNEGIKILRVVEPEADIYDISAQGYSFPSSHSGNAAALFGSLAIGVKKKWLTALAIAIPLLTGISRVVVGAHYPTDVLAGLALGAACAFLIPVLEKKLKNKLLLYALILVTVLPGLFFCKSADYFTGLGLLLGFMGGTLFEEKRVHFSETKKPLAIATRVIGGLAIYFLLNTVLKLPFSKEFLSGGSAAALWVRCARYAIIAFVDFGVYPMLFKVGIWA